MGMLSTNPVLVVTFLCAAIIYTYLTIKEENKNSNEA